MSCDGNVYLLVETLVVSEYLFHNLDNLLMDTKAIVDVHVMTEHESGGMECVSVMIVCGHCLLLPRLESASALPLTKGKNVRSRRKASESSIDVINKKRSMKYLQHFFCWVLLLLLLLLL